MKIIELTNEEFNEFAKSQALGSIYQTSYYGELLSEYYYDYELVGYKEDGVIIAASMILIRDITAKYKYGYAPRGFIIDYNYSELLTKFTKEIKKYFKKKKVIMIKIDPTIIIGTVEVKNNYQTTYNDNVDLPKKIAALGYIKLRNNLYFESQFPRFNAIVDLSQINNIDETTMKNILEVEQKGLEFVKGSLDDIKTIFDFSKDEKTKTLDFYRDHYNVFNTINSADLFLVNINYDNYLASSQNKYDELKRRYEQLLIEIQNEPLEKLLFEKKAVEEKLATYKNDIDNAIININKMNNTIAAGAIVIKYNEVIYIILSGYDEKFAEYYPYEYLFHRIFETYSSNGLKYANLNGLCGDFTDISPYKEMNDFKLKFSPSVYEYVGEFDLVIKKRAYNRLNSNGDLAKEFNKPLQKNIKQKTL